MSYGSTFEQVENTVVSELQDLEARSEAWTASAETAFGNFSNFLTSIGAPGDSNTFEVLELPDFPDFDTPDDIDDVDLDLPRGPRLPGDIHLNIRAPNIHGAPNWTVVYEEPTLSDNLPGPTGVNPIKDLVAPSPGNLSYSEPTKPVVHSVQTPDAFDKPGVVLDADFTYTNPAEPNTYTPGSIGAMHITPVGPISSLDPGYIGDMPDYVAKDIAVAEFAPVPDAELVLGTVSTPDGFTPGSITPAILDAVVPADRTFPIVDDPSSYAPGGVSPLNVAPLDPVTIVMYPVNPISAYTPGSVSYNDPEVVAQFTGGLADVADPTIVSPAFVSPISKPAPIAADLTPDTVAVPAPFVPYGVRPLQLPGDLTTTITVPTVAAPNVNSVGVVSLPDVGPAPVWDVLSPSFDYSGEPGDAPVSTLGVVPTVDALVLPTLDTQLIPIAPTLDDYDVISDISDLVMADLVVPLPTISELPDVGNMQFNYSEGSYASQLPVLQDEITRVMGVDNKIHRAIPSAIWDALWNRSVVQIVRQGIARMKEAREGWASQGWMLPGGTALAMTEQAAHEVSEQLTEKSLEMAIQDATQKREDFWQAVTQGIALEKLASDIFNAKQERALKAAIAEIEAMVSIYNAAVAKFNADIARAQLIIEQYKLALQKVTAQLDVERLRIEAAKARGELNEQRIKVYLAQWEAVKNATEVWKAQLDGARLGLENKKLEIEAFGESVKVRGMDLDAWAKLWDGYTAKLGGQKTKADVYSAMAQAFGERIKGHSVVADVEKTKVEAAVQIEQLRLEQSKTELEKYKALWSGIQTEVEAKARVFDIDAKIYATKTDAEKARVTADIGIEKLRMEASSLDVEQFKANTAYAQALFASKVQAFDSDVKLYAASIDAEKNRVNADIDIEKLRLEGSTLDVERYKAAVSEAQAESDANIRAYEANIRAFTARSEAEHAKFSAAIEMEKHRLDMAARDVERFKAEMAAAQAEVEAKARIYEADSKMFTANVDAERARVSADVEIEKMRSEDAAQALEKYKALMGRAQAEVDARMRGYEADARMYAAKAEAERGRVSADIEIEKLKSESAKLNVEIYKALLTGEQAKLQATASAYETKAKIHSSNVDAERTRVSALVEVEKINAQRVSIGIEKYKALLQMAQTVIDSKVKEYDAKTRIYATDAEVEKTRIGAEVEIEKLKASAVSTEVERYKAMWGGIQAKLQASSSAIAAKTQVYQTEVQAETARIESDVKIQELKMRGSELNIEAFKALWSGIQTKLQSIAQILTAEMQGFDAEVRLAQAKQSGDIEVEKLVQAHNQTLIQKYAAEIQNASSYVQAQAQAISAKASAYQAQASVEGTRVQGEVAIAQMDIANLNAEIEAFKAEWQAIGTQLQAKASLAQAQAQVYSAKGSIASAKSQAFAARTEAVIKQASLSADVNMKAAELSIQRFLGITNVQAEGLKALGQIYSQLVSATYAAANISVGMSAQASDSRSEQKSLSYNSGASYSVSGGEDTGGGYSFIVPSMSDM